MSTVQMLTCACCGGDGKETCHNPDHGFISSMGWHDIGRLGCPGCGHDPNHKVPSGGPCDECNGSGVVESEAWHKFVSDMGYELDEADFIIELAAVTTVGVAK